MGSAASSSAYTHLRPITQTLLELLLLHPVTTVGGTPAYTAPYCLCLQALHALWVPGTASVSYKRLT